MLKYGHFQRGTNHYLFYIDTNKFYDKNKAAIKKWLERVKKKLKEGHQDLFEKPCVLIAPTHETNIDFINLVNEQIFNDAAHAVHFDPLSEYEQNFQYLFQKTFQSSPYVFFVDDALCTGKTLHRVQEFFRRSGINKDITGYLVMINRLPVETYQNDKKEVGNIYSFTHLEAPVMEGIKEKCYLCREKSRYEEVLKNTIVDALRQKIHDKLNSKLNPHKKKKANATDPESREIRHLKRLELTHNLYHKLHKLSNIEEFVNKVSEGDRETKINLVKTLSQPPFIYYKEVRKKIYPFLLEELNAVFKSEKTRIEDIQYALILVKRLAYLECPQILTASFLERIMSVYNKIKTEGGVNLYQDWQEQRKEIEELRKKNSHGNSENRKGQRSFSELEKSQKLDNEIKGKISIFCQKHGVEEPFWESLQEQKQKPEDIINNFFKISTQFNLVYGLAVKEIIAADHSKAFRFEWELDKLLNNSDLHVKSGNDFYDLLTLLSLENNIILRSALKNLTDQDVLNENESNRHADDLKGEAFKDTITNTIKTNYKLSYLRYFTNYHKFLEENEGRIPSEGEFQQISDKLDDQFVKTNFYRNTFAPLLNVFLLVKSFKKEERSIDQSEGISHHINPLLKELLKIAHIDKQKGGVFLAIRKGYSLSPEISDLYVIGKIGDKSDNFDEYLTDENSWTIKMFNGVKTSREGEIWTNIERHQNDNSSKYLHNIKFDNLYEYKRSGASHFLFLRMTGFTKKENKEDLDPKGVLVFYKNEPFSLKEQRYLLLLRNELCEFLEKHYENYSFENVVHNIRVDNAFYKLVHTIRKNILRPITDNFRDKEEVKDLIAYLDNSSEQLDVFLKLLYRNDGSISYKNDFLNYVDGVITSLKTAKYHGRKVNFSPTNRFPPKVEISIPDIGENYRYRTLRTILEYILDNLIDNSFRHGKSEKVDIYLDIDYENNCIVLEVRDNGMGIVQKEKETNFFDSETGLGIGMFLAKNFTNMLNGKFDKINDKENEGTTIKIAHPLQNIIDIHGVCYG